MKHQPRRQLGIEERGLLRHTLATKGHLAHLSNPVGFMKNPAWNSPVPSLAKASAVSLKKVTFFSAAISAAEMPSVLLQHQSLQDSHVQLLVSVAVLRGDVGLCGVGETHPVRRIQRRAPQDQKRRAGGCSDIRL